MGMASINKAKNPSISKSTVIKRDNSVKVRLLERQLGSWLVLLVSR